MSQKVSPILFNNYIYNTSKWFNKRNNKFLLNEDLQIREIINIIFKNNINRQYFFIDKIVIYKYNSKIKIYIYYFCNFKYLKQNLINNNKFNIFYLYYKYLEILNIKITEILKILSFLKYNQDNILIYTKNLNINLNNSINSINKMIVLLKNYKINSTSYKNYKVKIYKTQKFIINLKKSTNLITKQQKYLLKRYNTLKYYKSIKFILYLLCYNDKFLNKLTASSLINVIFLELNSIDNASKNYNFVFYNIFNLLRDLLNIYFKDDNCKIKGMRIQIKGRYMLTKRKRIFIFNFGNLNLNKIDLNKDYFSLNLIKSTGASSIKIWISYK